MEYLEFSNWHTYSLMKKYLKPKAMLMNGWQMQLSVYLECLKCNIKRSKEHMCQLLKEVEKCDGCRESQMKRKTEGEPVIPMCQLYCTVSHKNMRVLWCFPICFCLKSVLILFRSTSVIRRVSVMLTMFLSVKTSTNQFSNWQLLLVKQRHSILSP